MLKQLKAILLFLGLLVIFSACQQVTYQPNEPTSILDDIDDIAILDDIAIDDALMVNSYQERLTATEGNTRSFNGLEQEFISHESLIPQATLNGAKGMICYIEHNSQAGQPWSIIVHNQSDDSKTRLYRGNRRINSVACDASGENIVFSMKETPTAASDYEIYKFSLGQTAPLRFTSNDFDDVQVSMDFFNYRFAWHTFIDEHPIINYSQPIDDESYRIISVIHTYPQTQPTLSGNGNYIALVRTVNNVYRIVLLDLVQLSYTVVYESENSLAHPSVSDSGQKMAWLEKANSATTRWIKVLDMASGNITNAQTHSSLDHPMLTRNGNYLTYEYKYRNSQNIYTLDLTTGSNLRITSTTSRRVNYYQPFWQWNDIAAISLDYHSPELMMQSGEVGRFMFTLSEDSGVVADVDASSLGSSFGDPVLGIFDMQGNLLTYSDDADGLDPKISINLTAGSYIVAVTGCCDYSFSGNHSQSGPYYLHVVEEDYSAAVSGTVDTSKVYDPVPTKLGVPKEAQFAAGELIVKFSPSLGLIEQQRILVNLGFSQQQLLFQNTMLAIKSNLRQIVRADSIEAKETLRLMAALQLRDDVIYVQPNYLRQALRTPNDSRYNEQWHYPLVNLPDAWDITVGDSSVIVAILDTGIAGGHPDFDCSRSIMGYDFVDYDTDSTDEGPSNSTGYHGTHVAGTIGACSNNRTGVTGIDWRAQLLHVRVLGPSGGYDSDIARGILWASGIHVDSIPDNNSPADVINMSLGGSGYSAIMQDAIIQADGAGTIVVVAAGNSTDDARNYSPAGLDRLITVGAVDRTSNLAWYSNYGPAVEIMAPGGDTTNSSANGVLSTLSDDGNNYSYGFYQGTSMASPHIAGIVALMKAVKPDLDLTYATAYLQNTAIPLSGDCERLGCGAGLVDALTAVDAASNNEPIGAILTADAVDFGRNRRTARLTLRNVGDSSTRYSLTINSSYITARNGSGTISAGGTSNITLRLNRSAFQDGSYYATATVTYDTKTLNVLITFQKGQVNDIGTVSVDLWIGVGGGYYDYLSTIYTSASEDYVFGFDALAAGDYALVGTGYNNQGESTAVVDFFSLARGETITDKVLELVFTPSNQGLPFKAIGSGKQ